MKKIFLKFLVLTLIVAAVSAMPAEAQMRADRALISRAEAFSGDKFTFSARTPKGVQIYSVSKPSPIMMREIDKGFTNLFAIARKHNYTRFLNYSDYTVFIAKPDRLKDINGNYSPDIAVGAAQYAGTDYDKGGYIYVAGLVLGTNPGAFLIGEHRRDFSRVSEVVRYEGEHIILYQNDRRLYNQTADHSRGGGHPILQ